MIKPDQKSMRGKEKLGICLCASKLDAKCQIRKSINFKRKFRDIIELKKIFAWCWDEWTLEVKVYNFSINQL